MPNYFFASSASRPIQLQGRIFKFTGTSLMGGRLSGVYEATDAGEVAVLQDAVKKKLGIKEISFDEFDAQKKRAQQTRPLAESGLSKARVIQPPLLPQTAIESAAGVPSVGLRPDGSQATIEGLPGPPTVTSLLRVGKVSPPSPLVAAEDRQAKRK